MSSSSGTQQSAALNTAEQNIGDGREQRLRDAKVVVAENKVAFALANLENVMLNGSPMDEEAFVRRAARESEPISPSKAKRMGKASKKGGDASEDGAGC